ncbi:MAG: hypothetical protein RR184_12305 [Citrobacter sp.]|uniref:Adhesin n=1 Tax=Citrobacter tructae TaxID=2562449 RepID=A0ABX5T9Y8_9ENTR|nr:hypothetical protein [Citrobacter tructae]QBX82843.1 hypothetical protein E4Z61_21760 [Citrobacter tructae]
MKRYRYHNFCKLPYLFFIFIFSGITFADEKSPVELEFDQNSNCKTENGIITCKLVSGSTSTSAGGTSSTPGGVADSRKNYGDKDLKHFKLAPNNGIGMLKDDLKSEDLRAEMNNKLLNESGKY